jgi:hypothetical protein
MNDFIGNIFFISTARAGIITDAPSVSQVGMKILFFLLSVTGIIAIISLVLAGALYFFAAGDEKKIETAKKAVSYSVLGIILAMSGMILVKVIGQFF